MARRKFIYANFTKDGDGVTVNANGDYSVTPAFWQLRSGNIIGDIHGIHISLSENKKFELGKFGAIGPLSAGIRATHRDKNDNILEDFFSGNIFTNGDLVTLADETEYVTDFKVTNEILVAKFRFLVDGQPLSIDFRNGEYVQFELNDDFSDLLELRFVAFGLYRIVTYENN